MCGQFWTKANYPTKLGKMMLFTKFCNITNTSVIIQEGSRSAQDRVIFFFPVLCYFLDLLLNISKNLITHAKLYFSEFYVLHLTVCYLIYKIYL